MNNQNKAFEQIRINCIKNFNDEALRLFHFQYSNNVIYHKYVNALSVDSTLVKEITDIPFLPINFFKTAKVITGNQQPEIVFESSGTTNNTTSKHHLVSTSLYTDSFISGFEKFYGSVKDYCILALLPSYLERGNSSLIFMANELISRSGNNNSGFYLNDYNNLASTINKLEKAGQKTLLLGVTYALLEMVEAFPMQLQHTIIMETGGMKGHGKEMLREEVHALLKQATGLPYIHSEYGMTELLSQAYAVGSVFTPPPWMRMLIRDTRDPLTTTGTGKGVLNIIDLANIYSCCFIATEDLGTVYQNNTFEVLGRLDQSDIRGCNLLV